MLRRHAGTNLYVVVDAIKLREVDFAYYLVASRMRSRSAVWIRANSSTPSNPP